MDEPMTAVVVVGIVLLLLVLHARASQVPTAAVAFAPAFDGAPVAPSQFMAPPPASGPAFEAARGLLHFTGSTPVVAPATGPAVEAASGRGHF